MIIDEEGMAKIKGKNPTDHNTIKLHLNISKNISKIDRTYVVKRTTWNIRASNEKWDSYTDKIEKLSTYNRNQNQ